MSDVLNCAGLTRIKIKQGERFDQTLLIPADFADGHFLGATLTGAVCTRDGAKVADLLCTWDGPATREIRMVADTGAWPIRRLYSDVLIYRSGDGLSRYTQTIRIRVSPSFAKPA